jgi:hypothetical protein
MYTQIVHLLNNLNIEGHELNLKTVSLTAFAVNVNISPTICFSTSHNMSSVHVKNYAETSIFKVTP